MRQRPQYLLAAFARAGHPVFFVDPRESTPRRAEGVDIVPNLGAVPATGVIVAVHFAPVRSMFDGFDEPVILYDILDDLSIYDSDEVGMPEARRVRSHHPAVVSQAAVVTVSSQTLLERHRGEREDLLLVPNGVEPNRFAEQRPAPVDLPTGKEPIIGYHGAVAPWFDFGLYSAVATALPDLRFVIVGPVDSRVSADADRLAALSNVTMLGSRRSDDIPAYVRRFAVGTVPFVVDEMTKGVSPLKMYEYLSAGKPVVATPLPECVAHPLVATAATSGDFIDALRDAIVRGAEPGFAEESQASAREASWDARVAVIRERLRSLDLLRVP